MTTPRSSGTIRRMRRSFWNRSASGLYLRFWSLIVYLMGAALFEIFASRLATLWFCGVAASGILIAFLIRKTNNNDDL
jgi:hypothetical protein